MKISFFVLFFQNIIPNGLSLCWCDLETTVGKCQLEVLAEGYDPVAFADMSGCKCRDGYNLPILLGNVVQCQQDEKIFRIKRQANDSASSAATTFSQTASATTTSSQTSQTTTSHSTTPKSTTPNSTTSHNVSVSTSSSTQNTTTTPSNSTASTATTSNQTFTTSVFSNTTASSITTTTNEESTTEDPSEIILPDGRLQFGICNITSFSNKDKKTVEILLYVSSGWVIAFTALTIITDIYFRVIGHHRFIDFVQELAIIAVFVFMGGFVLRPDLTTLCRWTILVLQFLLNFILLTAFIQGVFLASLIRGSSIKNSVLPWPIGYFIPPALAAGMTAAFYYTLKSNYRDNGVHFPGWGFYLLALLANQQAITACKMTNSDVIKLQFYWAKKSCRGLPILMGWFIMCFFTLLFGIDMQRLWIIAVYTALCILFGPLIFIFHTYCYEQVATSIFAKTSLAFYKPCTQKKNSKKADIHERVDLREKHPLSDPIIPLRTRPSDYLAPPLPYSAPAMMNPPLADMPAATANNLSTGFLPTSPQDLYNWITDRNFANVHEVENVLFKKNV